MGDGGIYTMYDCVNALKNMLDANTLKLDSIYEDEQQLPPLVSKL
jgi:hypothetical protein